jgi:hypothetical protein
MKLRYVFWKCLLIGIIGLSRTTFAFIGFSPVVQLTTTTTNCTAVKPFTFGTWGIPSQFLLSRNWTNGNCTVHFTRGGTANGPQITQDCQWPPDYTLGNVYTMGAGPYQYSTNVGVAETVTIPDGQFEVDIDVFAIQDFECGATKTVELAINGWTNDVPNYFGYALTNFTTNSITNYVQNSDTLGGVITSTSPGNPSSVVEGNTWGGSVDRVCGCSEYHPYFIVSVTNEYVLDGNASPGIDYSIDTNVWVQWQWADRYLKVIIPPSNNSMGITVHALYHSKPRGSVRLDFVPYYMPGPCLSNAQATVNILDTCMPEVSDAGTNSSGFQCTIHNSYFDTTCKVYASTNLTDWVLFGTLATTNSLGSLTDTGWTNFPYRFYRVNDTGTNTGSPAGFIRLSLGAGYSYIANQLITTNSSIASILPQLPPGSTFYKWDETNATYVSSSFRFGSWSNPNLTLDPGEGAILSLPSAAVITFFGSVPNGHLVNPIPSGWSLRSSLLPQTGLIATDLGLTPTNGQIVDIWDDATQSYISYTYRFGSWASGEPTLRIGQCYFNSSNVTNDWIRDFSLCSP